MKPEHLDQTEKQANDLLAKLDEARAAAVSAGSTPAAAGEIGKDAELVALAAISLVQELRAVNGAHTALALIMPHVRKIDDIIEAHVEGRALPEEPEASEAKHEPTREPTPAEIKQMEGAVRTVAPSGAPPPPEEPAGGTGTPPPPGGKTRRAPEAPKELDKWEPSAEDIAALPYEEAWIRGQLAAFHLENRGRTGARPRVTFAAFLQHRDGASDHARK